MIESITAATAELHSVHTFVAISIVVHSVVAAVMAGDFFDYVVVAATAAGCSATDYYHLYRCHCRSYITACSLDSSNLSLNLSLSRHPLSLSHSHFHSHG
mmetsp:Transcript_26728/g.28757  ORF Transcript_26728/g.28757 Transcript_26728/m.28757 type:complete len:100 (-) Transcript_26728:229-528(-)